LTAGGDGGGGLASRDTKKKKYEQGRQKSQNAFTRGKGSRVAGKETGGSLNTGGGCGKIGGDG